MAGEMKILGRIRKLLEAVDAETPGGDPREATLTQQLEQLVVAGAPAFQEYTRVGRSLWTGTTAAIAAVVAIPTTAHMLALYNNEPDGGLSYVMDFVAAQNVVSTAVASQAQILVNIGQIRETAPTDAALSIKKLNGLGGGTPTRARTILNATALPATTGLAANWLPWGYNAGKPGAAATPGYGIWSPIEGRIIVPPGRYFAMHVLANVVGETFVAFMGWHELQLQLG
jgi:hypothetical protein